jgi:putative membrane-bound dehydrogenase-like protein
MENAGLSHLRAIGRSVFAIACVFICSASSSLAAERNDADPYSVGLETPRLTTPQWVGEAGVEAVVILSIDDLRDQTAEPKSVEQYETFLRPIIQRLKKFDETSGLSIMTCQVDPQGSQLQTWLKEGVSLEAHTFDHPCPIPTDSDFAAAKSTYDRCVDLLGAVPNNKPVAFRMPCCDSMNTPSAKFYAEIFNKKTPSGAYLSIDSSVFNVTTAKDPIVPKEFVTEADGRERFRKYIPSPSFTNVIENYPYPYVIGGLCWEFPCATPSDWQGQNKQRPGNPKTVDDLKTLIDVTVIKQGVMPVVFHPHGWIKSEQIVELIDHAAAKHGKKVKFLNFAEAQRRLNQNLLLGQSLRNAEGGDNGVRLKDVNADSFVDVVINNEKLKTTRVWDAKAAAWKAEASPQARPLSPEEALKTFKIYPGFKIDLAVAEPMVMDPIAFNWTADGRLWVVEMGDYPLGTDGKGTPGGVVRVLEDTNADGTYDKSTVFLDKLGFPTGVTPYRKGVLVLCVPDLFYAEDTDGDGKADKREVLFTGFGEGNPQHRANGLIYGPDNWFHGANGDSGGQIRSMKTGKVVDINGRDFRINPDTGEIDPTTGQSQFGRARDEWGNWFGCNNSNPGFHFVLDDRYMRRNPHVAAPDARRDVAEVPGPSQVFPISKTEARFNFPESANHFTSACSLLFYRDELFGSGYRGNSFVSEPVHNLIHREIVWQDGLLVKSRRADDEHRMEFIASSDNWFRPAMLRVGPDGAMWIADMYRQVIEHPEWIPKDVQKKLDLRAGHDKGRLYRVYPAAKKLREIPNLTKLDTAGLVAALDAPGSWQRDMVQQLVIERQDKAAVPLLETMAAKSLRALARMQALCTLDGLNSLQPTVLIAAMDDVQPGVRMHAVRLAEKRFGESADLAKAALTLAKDPDPIVRMQLACSLGEWNDPRAGEALGLIAMRDAKDPFISAGVTSSLNASNIRTVIRAATQDKKRVPSASMMANFVRVAAGCKSEPAMVSACEAVAGQSDVAKQFFSLASLLDALEVAGTSLGELRTRSVVMREAIDPLTKLFDAARKTAVDEGAPVELRAAAVKLVGRGSAVEQSADAKLLGRMVTPQTPEPVQLAAVASLSKISNESAAAILIEAWPGMTPALRAPTLDAFLQHSERTPQLLDAIESRKLLPADLDASRRRQLLEHADEAIRARAQKIFAGAIDPDRQKVIDAFAEAATLKGDVASGKVFFASACATCHKVGDVGVNVGPDLMSVADQSPGYYLLHILDPNRAVEAKYVNYVIETKTGQIFSGVLSGESGNSVTLTGAGSTPQTVLRADLKRMKATGMSAMPVGLEVGRKPQEFADLLAFLASRGQSPAAVKEN